MFCPAGFQPGRIHLYIITGLLLVVVAIYGFAHGGFFTVVSPTTAEYFGMKAHGAVFGTILFFGTLGGAFGPILTGIMFDSIGTYQPAFITLATAAVIGLVLARTLPRHGVTAPDDIKPLPTAP